ncbi:MAG: energy-coupling factor transport system permease protein [Microbacteriaceae bacterium]|jgi:energy-coupling factor transport system permease protein|nr:energy-coupling factor transport system permease protein [Microbacteriaceae bacterium]
MTGRAIQQVNPVAKLAAALVLSVALVLTVDWVSASVALVLESVLFFWAGLSFKTFFLRTSPVLIAAPFGALTLLLY